MSGYVFVDEESVGGGWRKLAAGIAAREQEQILRRLGETNASKFNTVGFCQDRPVQILSPFSVPPGSLRRAWMDQFLEVRWLLDDFYILYAFHCSDALILAHIRYPFFVCRSQREVNGQLDSMLYLLYWFDTSLSEKKPHITLEPCDSFVSYEDGQEAGYGDIPRPIQNKILWNEERTAEEQIVMDSLRLMERAKKSGVPAFETVPDHELFDVVPSEVSQNPNSLMLGLNPRKQKHSTDTNGDGPTEMPKQGDRIAVWWDGDGKYYDGTVVEVRESFFNLHYDDSDTEWLPLADCDFKFLSVSSRKRNCLVSDNIDRRDDCKRARNTSAELPSARPGHLQWTSKEDAIIMDAVKNSSEQPFKSWPDIVERVPGRSARQVRERWNQVLNPVLDHSPLSREDDLILWDGHGKLGNKWTEISAQFFNNTRSERLIKGRWKSTAFKKFIAGAFGPKAWEEANSKMGGRGDDSVSEDQGGLSEKVGEPGEQPREADNEIDESPTGLLPIIDEWKVAVSNGDATTARDKVMQVYNLVESVDYGEIDSAFFEVNLRPIMLATRSLLKENQMLTPELYVLEGILDEGVEYEEETADI